MKSDPERLVPFKEDTGLILRIKILRDQSFMAMFGLHQRSFDSLELVKQTERRLNSGELLQYPMSGKQVDRSASIPSGIASRSVLLNSESSKHLNSQSIIVVQLKCPPSVHSKKEETGGFFLYERNVVQKTVSSSIDKKDNDEDFCRHLVISESLSKFEAISLQAIIKSISFGICLEIYIHNDDSISLDTCLENEKMQLIDDLFIQELVKLELMTSHRELEHILSPSKKSVNCYTLGLVEAIKNIARFETDQKVCGDTADINSRFVVDHGGDRTMVKNKSGHPEKKAETFDVDRSMLNLLLIEQTYTSCYSCLFGKSKQNEERLNAAEMVNEVQENQVQKKVFLLQFAYFKELLKMGHNFANNEESQSSFDELGMVGFQNCRKDCGNGLSNYLNARSVMRNNNINHSEIFDSKKSRFNMDIKDYSDDCAQTFVKIHQQ